jgi:glycosyltransferase involved in cell wall biosynthesis
MGAVAPLSPRDSGSAAIITRDVVVDNAAWRDAKPEVSITIPAFRHDASFLIEALSRLGRSALVEVIVHDDGSRDAHMRNRMEAAAQRASMPVRLVFAAANRGRAGARNLACRQARAPWVLMLDADMQPDDINFIAAYIDATRRAARPCLIVGGISLKSASTDRRYALHRWQSQQSECLPASVRTKSPGRYVFTGNVLAHRDVLAAIPFDEAFAGWGWEDTDWGLRVEQSYPIHHIDNAATHAGLDTDAALLSKYSRSTANFALLAARHPDAVAAMPLYRAAKALRGLPGRKVVTQLSGKLLLAHALPVAIRGRLMKLWRALTYAEEL